MHVARPMSPSWDKSRGAARRPFGVEGLPGCPAKADAHAQVSPAGESVTRRIPVSRIQRRD